MRPTVVGIGEVLWDHKEGLRSLGGAPANFAFHAAQFEADGVVASAVGTDGPGDDIKTELEGLGLTTEFLQTNRQDTGRVDVHNTDLHPDQPGYTIRANAAWDSIEFVERLRALAPRASAVCFGSLAQRSPVSRSTIRTFLSRVGPDTVRVFDVNLRESLTDAESLAETIETSLGLADVFKLNDLEVPQVASRLGLPTSLEDFVSGLFKRFSLRVVALTRGDRGSALYTRDETSDHSGCPLPGPQAGIKPDAVGAGDSFTAVVTIGLLRGYDLDRINAHANCVAAYVCSRPGATPRLPDHLLTFPVLTPA